MFRLSTGGVAGSPGAGRLVNGALPEDSAATTKGRSWPVSDLRPTVANRPLQTVANAVFYLKRRMSRQQQRSFHAKARHFSLK